MSQKKPWQQPRETWKKPVPGELPTGRIPKSPAELAISQWKAGECQTPGQVVKRRSEAAGILMLLLATQDSEGRFVNAQRFFDAVLKSEYLMGKYLDKMMPTLTPEQLNVIAGTFEQRVLNISGGDAPRPDAPSVEEPTTERGPFEGHVDKMIDAMDAGAQPATPMVVKPAPKRAGA